MRVRAAVLIALALLTALGCPVESWAQTKIARVGILVTPLAATETAMAEYYEPFLRMLAHEGWIEGKNVLLEYRSAHGNPPRYDQPAAELVGLQVDVIYANSAPATRAAYAATRTIAIVGLGWITPMTPSLLGTPKATADRVAISLGFFSMRPSSRASGSSS
jgi:putative tryptophan/tyrosine transport system substrate-binding protein